MYNCMFRTVTFFIHCPHRCPPRCVAASLYTVPIAAHRCERVRSGLFKRERITRTVGPQLEDRVRMQISD